jgi:hypothetical protein
MLVPVPVPERAFDPPIGTWATEKTRPLIVPVVPGSLSEIEVADVADQVGQHAPPPLAKDTLD